MWNARCDRAVVSGGIGDGAVVQEALECSNVVEMAQCYIASSMFSKLHTLMESSQLYTLKDGAD